MKADIYQTVTDTIIAALEAGTRPWVKPWKDGAYNGGVELRASGEAYRGINQVILGMSSWASGYTSPYWMTYKQAAALGGNVRKGEKGTHVVYFGAAVDKKHTPQAGEDQRTFTFAKSYCVFNASQCDGLPSRFNAPSTPAPSQAWPELLHVEGVLQASGVPIQNGGNKAFYIPSMHRIQLPETDQFPGAPEYYGTALHELTHATGHTSILNRNLSGRFGSAAYAAEELIAEMGAAFLCAALGVSPTVREDHASYIASWLKVMREDKRAVFKAATEAQKAADWVLKRAGRLASVTDGEETVEACAA
jgi:antirestriction protein ArdC